MSDLHRLNIEIIDGQVCICFDLHEKGQPCEYEPQSPEQIVKLLNSAGRQIFQLKQRIEQLERERNEYRDKWIRKCKELDIVDEQLAQRDIEQQIKALNDLVDWAYEVPEREFTTVDIMNRAFDLEKQLLRDREHE